MADFNIVNTVPFNVNVPEYQPERSAPIFPQITRKYPCIEDVVGGTAKFNTLTWKIQQPDRSMVWTSVKLVLPFKMESFGDLDDVEPDPDKTCQWLEKQRLATLQLHNHQ